MALISSLPGKALKALGESHSPSILSICMSFSTVSVFEKCHLEENNRGNLLPVTTSFSNKEKKSTSWYQLQT